MSEQKGTARYLAGGGTLPDDSVRCECGRDVPVSLDGLVPASSEEARAMARARHDLECLVEHARLDHSERGVTEAQRYESLAEDALEALARVDEGQGEALARAELIAAARAVVDARTRVRRREEAIDRLSRALTQADEGER
jgi:hypothetical protein